MNFKLVKTMTICLTGGVSLSVAVQMHIQSAFHHDFTSNSLTLNEQFSLIEEADKLNSDSRMWLTGFI